VTPEYLTNPDQAQPSVTGEDLTVPDQAQSLVTYECLSIPDQDQPSVMSPRNYVLDGVQIPHGRGNSEGKGRPLYSIGTLCRELCNNVWTDFNDLYIYDVFPRKDVTF